MKIDWKKGIFSDGSPNFVSNIDPKIGDIVKFSIRIPRIKKPDNVFMVVWPKGEVFYLIMKLEKSNQYFDFYSVEYKIETYKLFYRFYLIIDGKEYYYTPYGLYDYEPGDYFSFILYADADYSKWPPESIFYQIFPDRFYRSGDTKLDDRKIILKFKDKEIEIKRVLSNWDEPVCRNIREKRIMQFYGGNFKGIQEKIPYLKELGITAIYLTPIFLARTNHRYDIEDYTKPDTLLGTEKDLEELIKELHNNGIKVIFDAVLNHTGLFHSWFDMLGENAGAFSSKESFYKDFYYFNDHPYEFESWMDSKILPQLNLKNKELKNRLLYDKESAIKKWLYPPFNIDGWRMDTASILGKFDLKQIDEEFSKDLHSSIKEASPDAYIMGETFYDPKQLIDREKYEATMNYRGFMSPIKKWLCGVINFMSVPGGNGEHKIKFTAKKMAKQLSIIRNSISYQNQIRMFNLLNSHDTKRFLTEVNCDFRRYKIAVTLLFTYIGTPSIYYGDEVGLEGEGDPDCRRPMIWDEKKQNKEINNLYKKLIGLRKGNKTLIYGSFIELSTRGNVFSFARFYEDDIIIVICNGNDKKKDIILSLFSIGIFEETFYGFYSNTNYKVNEGNIYITLDEYGCEILLLK